MIEKDGKNLWRSLIIFYILVMSIILLGMHVRLAEAEKKLEERTPLVNRFLDLEHKTIQNGADIDLLLRHHLELMERLNQNEK